jgi:hypothetical protein
MRRAQGSSCEGVGGKNYDKNKGGDGDEPVLFWEQPRKRFQSEFEMRKFTGCVE